MDLGFIIGMPAGFVAIIAAILVGGFPLSIFMDLVSVIITVVGSFCALMVSSSLKDVLKMPTYFGIALKEPKSNIGELIKQLVTFSEKARREGLLSLEDDVDNLSDAFFKQGIRMVVDSMDPEVIKGIMYNELNQMNARHAIGIGIMDRWNSFAPAFGMIGTLYGLVGMLSSMGDPSSIGAGMSAALITTFYGAIMSNLVLAPVRDKLKLRDSNDTAEKEVILEGILSIQAGENPRTIEEKLLAFVPPKDRAKIKQTSD